VVAALLSAVLVFSGFGKLTKSQSTVDGLTSIGVLLGLFPFLAECEIAGAVGLVVGIWWAPLGIAAAIGVVLYFVLASGQHVRKKDMKGLPPAVGLGVVGAAALVLGIASL
jgi:hypothetical protein